jgi:hypothetical protein
MASLRRVQSGTVIVIELAMSRQYLSAEPSAKDTLRVVNIAAAAIDSVVKAHCCEKIGLAGFRYVAAALHVGISASGECLLAAVKAQPQSGSAAAFVVMSAHVLAVALTSQIRQRGQPTVHWQFRQWWHSVKSRVVNLMAVASVYPVVKC